MKYSLKTMLPALALVLHIGCFGQSALKKINLTATEFAQKIKETPNANVLDVRTANEYAKGHLYNAKNIDWNGSNFAKQTANLDKTKPVFLYCHSGGRSTEAATQMLADGFKEVYELTGGIAEWRAARLPEAPKALPPPKGITRQQFEEMVMGNKMVLIDFYAEWCGPCKKMKPFLEEIKNEMPEKLTVVSINVDQNPDLSNDLGISAIPFLQVYKNSKLTWAYTGYINKKQLVKHLK